MTSRKKVVAGNWKMNLSLLEAKTLVSELVNMYNAEINGKVPMWLFPPACFINPLAALIPGQESIALGSQDCSANEKGAFTGELSASMLASVGARYVLIGHSERRQYHKEDNALLTKKLEMAFANNLVPVFCIGETLAERQSGSLEQIIEHQLQPVFSIKDFNKQAKIVLAYEPVWAIGTGETATPEQAQAVHAFIRNKIASFWNADLAETILILYGGSVNAVNASSLFNQQDIDGGLVGGASLKSREFIQIIKSCI